MAELDHIRQFLAAEGILMCFHGPFRHSIIEELGKAVRKHLETETVRKSAMVDVFSVFIEATQNVSNYANRKAWEEAERARVQNGILVIGRQGEAYQIRCGNFIHPRDTAALLARLDHLATLDAAGLKALYKEKLHAEVAPDVTGAGLGLIRMARTASKPLCYAIAEGHGGLDFFSLTVIL
jgi:hypothetical protein